jgi:hypothetical protein
MIIPPEITQKLTSIANLKKCVATSLYISKISFYSEGMDKIS